MFFFSGKAREEGDELMCWVVCRRKKNLRNQRFRAGQAQAQGAHTLWVPPAFLDSKLCSRDTERGRSLHRIRSEEPLHTFYLDILTAGILARCRHQHVQTPGPSRWYAPPPSSPFLFSFFFKSFSSPSIFPLFAFTFSSLLLAFLATLLLFFVVFPFS